MNIVSEETSLKARKTERLVVERIGRRNVLSILMLSTAGQIAWAVENGWFNTFVFDRITTDPTPLAWMVAVSAITATVTTIIMGILSDRTSGKWGKRKPFIVFGYFFWGLITALYPLTELIQVVGIAIVMVIVADAVMTFFGSTANDAAYNAWCTDIGHSSNRNRIQAFYFLPPIQLLIAQNPQFSFDQSCRSIVPGCQLPGLHQGSQIPDLRWIMKSIVWSFVDCRGGGSS